MAASDAQGEVAGGQATGHFLSSWCPDYGYNRPHNAACLAQHAEHDACPTSARGDTSPRPAPPARVPTPHDDRTYDPEFLPDDRPTPTATRENR